jgi:hypothetical protein
MKIKVVQKLISRIITQTFLKNLVLGMNTMKFSFFLSVFALLLY